MNYTYITYVFSQILHYSQLIGQQYMLTQRYEANELMVLSIIIISLRSIEILVKVFLKEQKQLNQILFYTIFIIVQPLTLEITFITGLDQLDIQLITLSLVINQIYLNQTKNQLILLVYLTVVTITRFIIDLSQHSNYWRLISLAIILIYINVYFQLNKQYLTITKDQQTQYEELNQLEKNEENGQINEEQQRSKENVKKFLFKKLKQNNIYKKWQSCSNQQSESDNINVEIESSLRSKNQKQSFKNLLIKEEQSVNRQQSQSIFGLNMNSRRNQNQMFSLLSLYDHQDSSQNLSKNLFNLFPSGIMIINQQKQLIYSNNKCEKLLECQSTQDKLLNQLKKIILNANVNDGHQRKNRFNYCQIQVEEMIRSHQIQNKEFDVYDYLFSLTKFIKQKSGVSPKSSSSQQQYFLHIFDRMIQEQEQLSMVSCLEQQQQIKLSYSFQSKIKNQIKQLRIQIIISQLNQTPQEQSQNDSLNYIFILIKNISSKYDYKKLKSQMEFSNKLLKSFSHELRTPLNCSVQMLQVAKDTVNQSSQAKYFIGQALISNQLLIYQINDILDFSALQCNSFTYQFQTISLEEVYQEILHLYQDACDSKNIKLLGEYDTNLKAFFIKTDKNRLIQILVNLMNNSLKYTQQYGEINFCIKQNRQMVKIIVKDTGIGINKKDLENIKKITENVKRYEKNLFQEHIGLGITISSTLAQGLTNSQDNIIKIKSEQQKGTKISFQIQHIAQTNSQNNNYKIQLSTTPKNQLNHESNFEKQNSKQFIEIESNQNQDINLQRSQSYKTPQIKENNSNIDLDELNSNDQPEIEFKLPPKQTIFFNEFQEKSVYNNKTFLTKKIFCRKCVNVLLVDDVPFNQMALKSMLNHYQIDVDQAYDGYQALKLVQNKQNSHCKCYKLIFMDIEMPGIDGFKTTQQIFQYTNQQQLEKPFVFMCSAYDTCENYELGKQVGMIDFIPKPVRKTDLDKKLKKYIYEYDS